MHVADAACIPVRGALVYRFQSAVEVGVQCFDQLAVITKEHKDRVSLRIWWNVREKKDLCIVYCHYSLCFVKAGEKHFGMMK